MNFLRFILLRLLRLYVRFKFNIKVNNLALIPAAQRPLLFISNHPSLMDTLIYKCVLKQEFYVCGAKEKYFSTAGKRFIMKLARIIKVTKEDKFLEDCKMLLNRKYHILIYPEMGRFPEMSQFISWGAKVAQASGATVIPMRISGTASKPVKNIEINIGRAFSSPAGMDSSALNEIFFTKIKEL